jgi:hypothetical protein
VRPRSPSDGGDAEVHLAGRFGGALKTADAYVPLLLSAITNRRGKIVELRTTLKWYHVRLGYLPVPTARCAMDNLPKAHT